MLDNEVFYLTNRKLCAQMYCSQMSSLCQMKICWGKSQYKCYKRYLASVTDYLVGSGIKVKYCSAQ